MGKFKEGGWNFFLNAFLAEYVIFIREITGTFSFQNQLLKANIPTTLI